MISVKKKSTVGILSARDISTVGIMSVKNTSTVGKKGNICRFCTGISSLG
jgi:hypothetical protein